MHTFTKAICYILFILLLAACSHPGNVSNDNKQADTVSVGIRAVVANTIDTTKDSELSVIVMPAYDEIANAGISPNIRKCLETALASDSSLMLIKFPFKQLVNVSYQNVFDKKFCQPIVDKTKADIIVMSKLEQAARTGKMASDRWNFQLRIYNTRTGTQINSAVSGNHLTGNQIRDVIENKKQILTAEIKSIR